MGASDSQNGDGSHEPRQHNEPDERTALLSGRGHKYVEENGQAPVSLLQSTRREQDEETQDDLDANEEAELLLERTISLNSASGLSPQCAGTSLLHGRTESGSNLAKKLGCGPERHNGSLNPDDFADLEGGRGERGAQRNLHNEGHEQDDAVPTHAPHSKHKAWLIDTDPRRFNYLFAMVLITFFLAFFDSTIMASSHPVITSYFHSSNTASWLSTAFLLTSTAFQPMIGRLSDTLGRKLPFMITIGIFASATAWCALAGSMGSFIAARAVCGLGAGGMMALGSIIVSDVVDIERRGIYQSYMNISYGISSASGAALGGIMADTLGWRWEFGIQVFPLMGCIVVAFFVIPGDLGVKGKKESLRDAISAFDFRGSLLLTTATTFLILGLNLGGNVLPWSHPFIIASLAVFGACFPTFLFAETKAKRPIMPLELLSKMPRANLIFSNFVGAFLMNAILFNIPLFFQAVLLTSATSSGLRLIIPILISSWTGAMTGVLITFTKRLKWPLMTGAVLYVLGTFSLTFLRRDWPTWVYWVVIGPSVAGQGFQFPGTFIAILAVSSQAEQAVVTSTLVLWRALGSVLGIAISSLVLQNSLLGYLQAYVTGEGGVDRDEVIARVRESVEAVARLHGQTQDEVVHAYQDALSDTFKVLVGVAMISLLLITPIRMPRLGARTGSS